MDKRKRTNGKVFCWRKGRALRRKERAEFAFTSESFFFDRIVDDERRALGDIIVLFHTFQGWFFECSIYGEDGKVFTFFDKGVENIPLAQ